MQRNLARIRRLEEQSKQGFNQIENLLSKPDDKKLDEISDFEDEDREEVNLYDHDDGDEELNFDDDDDDCFKTKQECVKYLYDDLVIGEIFSFA